MSDTREQMLVEDGSLSLSVCRLNIIGGASYPIGGTYDHYKRAQAVLVDSVQTLWKLTDVSGDDRYIAIPHAVTVVEYRDTKGKPDADTNVPA